jgi:dinuclear metal center YbgI/SA1388 family protein
MSATQSELAQACDLILSPANFQDYCPNGVQVEGARPVSLVATGTSASLAFIEQALASGADALIVHHGLFWRGQDGRVAGWMRARLKALLASDASLLAYHLPLDAHPDVGNNAMLAKAFGFSDAAALPGKSLVWAGKTSGCSLSELASHVESAMNRPCIRVAGDGRAIARVAWCSGGAQGSFEEAIAAGADAYISGEISEPQAHIARETGVAYIAAGHHATERLGAQAFGALVAARLGIGHIHIDIDNPA